MDGREYYAFILLSSILPLVGVAAAVVLLWNLIVGPADSPPVVISASRTTSGQGVMSRWSPTQQCNEDRDEPAWLTIMSHMRRHGVRPGTRLKELT